MAAVAGIGDVPDLIINMDDPAQGRPLQTL